MLGGWVRAGLIYKREVLLINFLVGMNGTEWGMRCCTKEDIVVGDVVGGRRGREWRGCGSRGRIERIRTRRSKQAMERRGGKRALEIWAEIDTNGASQKTRRTTMADIGKYQR